MLSTGTMAVTDEGKLFPLAGYSKVEDEGSLLIFRKNLNQTSEELFRFVLIYPSE